MTKALIGSLSAAALLGAGLVAGRATASATSAPARATDRDCIEGRCDATIECKDGGCVIEWTAPDGRTGVIELSCQDGECKVVRCEPACSDECPPAKSASVTPAPAKCATDPGCCK